MRIEYLTDKELVVSKCYSGAKACECDSFGDSGVKHVAESLERGRCMGAKCEMYINSIRLDNIFNLQRRAILAVTMLVISVGGFHSLQYIF